MSHWDIAITAVLSEKPDDAPKEHEPWSMIPWLHRKVAAILKKDGLNYKFHEVDDPISCTEQYDTRIMGKFHCRECRRGGKNHSWKSKAISITIRKYGENKYNVRVYHQKCERCEKIKKPKVDEAVYVERVVYRLKKWEGLKPKLPVNRRDDDDDEDSYSGGHRRRLCEGCRLGHCAYSEEKMEEAEKIGHENDSETEEIDTMIKKFSLKLDEVRAEREEAEAQDEDAGTLGEEAELHDEEVD